MMSTPVAPNGVMFDKPEQIRGQERPHHAKRGGGNQIDATE